MYVSSISTRLFVGMLTPAIRAIRFLSSAPRVWRLRRKIPRGPTPISTLHGPGSKRKSRRAHERAAGQPVDRDEREIGFAHRRVKAPALQSSPNLRSDGATLVSSHRFDPRPG